MAKRSPYPLQWPSTYSRTKPENRKRSTFGHRGQLSPYEAAKGVVAELSRLGAVHGVIVEAVDAGDLPRAKRAVAQIDREYDRTNGRIHDCPDRACKESSRAR